MFLPQILLALPYSYSYDKYVTEISTSPTQRPVTLVEKIFRRIPNAFLWLVKRSVKIFLLIIGNILALGFSIFLLIILLIIIGTMFAPDSSEKDASGLTRQSVYRDFGGDEKIAYVELSGVILDTVDRDNPFASVSDVVTPTTVEKIFSAIEKDDEFRGVIMYISSPGGSPTASDRIYETISTFREKTKVPVIAILGDIAASGGYYIASAADNIIAQPTTITGSIGVILETYNLSGLYEKVGVKKEVFKAGRYKDILDDARDITDEEKQMINSIMQDTYDTFIDRVVQGRQLSESQVRQAAEGKIYSGKQAKNVKLVDEVLSFEDSLLYAAEKSGVKKFKLIKLKGGSFFEEVFSEVNTKINGLGVQLGFLSLERPRYQILYKMP